MKERTKIAVLLTGGVLAAGLALGNYMYHKDKTDDLNVTEEKAQKNITPSNKKADENTTGTTTEKAKEIEYKNVNEKYSSIMDIIYNAPMIGYFDQSKKDPIDSVVGVYDKDSNLVKVEFNYIDNATSSHKVKYIVTSDSNDYEAAQKKGEEHKLKNGITAYYWDSKYHWKDEKSNRYGSIFSIDFMTTNKDDVLSILETITPKTKYNAKQNISYTPNTSILIPTYQVAEKENVSVTLKYKQQQEETGKNTTTVSFSYDSFELTESGDMDFAKDTSIEPDNIIKKQVHQQKADFYENAGVLIFKLNGVSVKFKPTKESLFEKDEYLKIVESAIK